MSDFFKLLRIAQQEIASLKQEIEALKASQIKAKAEGIREAVKKITITHRTMESLYVIDQILDYAAQLEKGE